MSALAMVAGKHLNRKNWFPDPVFHITIADAAIGSLKSPYIIW